MNVADRLATSLFRVDVPIVAAASLPQVSCNPALPLGLVRDTLLDRLQDQRHRVRLIERVDQQMDMVWHEDIGENSKAVVFGGPDNAPGKGDADTLVR